MKKPVSTEDQVVTDQQGRRRFHGAFTGGFSAGYYNTVDTPEGWTPATFVSSRSSKAGKVQQRPEDFMDEEDMGEFGIAPKMVTTTKEFVSEEKEDVRRKRAAAAADQHSVLPALLQDLIIPARESIGVRLLRKMGWRDGTGIGAKVRRKIKMKRQAEVAPSQKLYGCAPPPGHRHSEEEEDEDDPFTHGHEFAPKDVLPMSYQPKDNMHGIGYRGLVPTDFLGPSMSTARLGPKSKGMKGQAFGVGVFEEEDDDIYTTDSMANYDFTAAGVEVQTQSQLKQTRHGHQMPSIETKAPEGFVLSARAAQPKQVFPPPAVPRDFRPVHRFSRPAEGELQTAGRHSLTALQRAQALGEKPPTEQMSVFDLISTADKEAIKTVQLHKNVTAAAPVPPVAPAPPAPPAVHTDRQSATTTTGNMGNFRPFSRDAAKQQRYEEYIRAAKSGAKDPMPAAPSGMTEWERDREREEFVRAYQLYQPLHGMMASRFTRGKHLDQPTTDQPPSLQEEVSDKAKAAGMKMFGRLTRDRMEWHPDRLLCRRFNVPNPYPESTVVGLCTLKKEKYTFANFLNMPVESRSSEHSSSTTTNSKGKETPESQEVSKNTSKVAGGEERGVLSYLCESEDVPSTSEQDTRMQEDPDVSKKLDTDKEKPPLDLFKAIFQSSSDSSGGSDDSEEGEDMDDTRGEGGESKGGGGEARGLGGKTVEVDNSDGALEQDRDKPLDNITADPADTGKLDSGTHVTDPKLSVVTSPDSHVSRWDRSEAQVTVEQAQVTVEQAQVTVEQAQLYGPALPPTVSGGVSTSPHSHRPATADSSSHRHKHSHRDKHKHKHKKDKKSKKSKQKHKKKSKKKRRWKDEGEDSGSERESSEESEDEVKSDLLNDQLLHRVRSLRHHISPADVL
ncbi:PREDICTED: G patch domain-containing protein 1-like isoform X1 [Branchiostoma belcheri]|uniref:G patch domain-containing protein 1-like isoform X1 n=2 Tax=Branchiostoma belcheri TaxID=7741 RepID=A0A6P4ZPA7_BRABE|nr:PREDICTED: G patch domain-containing protein 1-like isoform X1 [Branchiostoma belcheri]